MNKVDEYFKNNNIMIQKITLLRIQLVSKYIKDLKLEEKNYKLHVNQHF